MLSVESHGEVLRNDREWERKSLPPFAAAFVGTLFGLAVVALGAWHMTGGAERWAVFAGVVVVFIAFVCSVSSRGSSTEAFGLLANHFGELNRDYHLALEDREQRGRFIEEFRPPNGEVLRVLTAAAYKVRDACEAEDDFIRNGLGGPKGEPVIDPESQLTGRWRMHEVRKAELKAAVAKAKERFHYLRDSARSQAYEVPDSWTELAGLPQPGIVDVAMQALDDLRCGFSGTGVEGRNEQPGQ